jgi:ParB family chromosome partitioning protein
MTDIRKKLAGKTTKLAKERPRQDDHPANLNDYLEGMYYHIDINLILPDPEQPKKYLDPKALEELANSIREKGLYQPVVVRKDENGQIILVAGKRRLRAAKMAGIEKIPAIFTQGNPLEISIIENLQRENLKPIEEAEALGRMIERHGYTEEKLAFAIGKARSAISETIRLNGLPETIKDECRKNDKYPRQLLVEIAKQDTPEAMISLFNQAKPGNVKTDEVRVVAGKQSEIAKHTSAGIAMHRDVSLDALPFKAAIETVEQHRKTQLVTELQNLIRIIDEMMI